MATWYLDAGAGEVHKSKKCAERTARSMGAKSPLYKAVSAEHTPGWRSCKNCSQKIIMAQSVPEEEEEEEEPVQA